MAKADIGMVGLGVMGGSLALNMDGKGFSVIGYDIDPARTDAFIAMKAGGTKIEGVHTLEELADGLKIPRVIMMMAPAGDPVDQVINLLVGHLEPGDILIDGGNSYYKDTSRRLVELESRGLRYVGMGVSGGQEGALKGPSLMPGGSEAAWPHIEPIFQAIAAKVDDGAPCCQWVGPDGSGHFVKMVHNGIEYGDMQLIAEAYSLLRNALGLSPTEISDIFAEWNKGELNSYLIEITADIPRRKDPDTGKPIIDVILDEAQQKGTGSWAGESALQMGVPAPTIVEAVFARSISALKSERVEASRILHGPDARFDGDKAAFTQAIEKTLYASKICCYAQGFALMREASWEYGWGLKLGELALTWRAGCIIRARFLDRIKEAYAENPDIPNLLLAPYFADAVQKGQGEWRGVVGTAAKLGVSIPAFGSSLAYFDSYRSERLPANLIQAQRDYFGAHTYRRIDKEGVFHTDWSA